MLMAEQEPYGPSETEYKKRDIGMQKQSAWRWINAPTVNCM